MCIAIWKPHGKQISKETLKKCWNANPQGAGYMWAENGEVQIRKGFFKQKEFFVAWERDLPRINSYGSGAAIHFRIKTHGPLDIKNCHPHRINKTLAFIHNGILPLEVPKDSQFSDSAIFAQVFLDLPHDWYKRHNLRLLVELAIKRHNKMIFLDGAGEVTILNEDEGKWEDGVWYSNDHWKTTFVSKGTGFFHQREWEQVGGYWRPKKEAYVPDAKAETLEEMRKMRELDEQQAQIEIDKEECRAITVVKDGKAVEPLQHSGKPFLSGPSCGGKFYDADGFLTGG